MWLFNHSFSSSCTAIYFLKSGVNHTQSQWNNLSKLKVSWGQQVEQKQLYFLITHRILGFSGWKHLECLLFFLQEVYAIFKIKQLSLLTITKWLFWSTCSLLHSPCNSDHEFHLPGKVSPHSFHALNPREYPSWYIYPILSMNDTNGREDGK